MNTPECEPKKLEDAGIFFSAAGEAVHAGSRTRPCRAGRVEDTLPMRPYHVFIGMLIGILGMLLFLDILTTTMILDLGGTELNPAMQPIVDNPFLHLGVKATFAAFVMLMVVRAERKVEYSGAAILTAVCSFFGVVFVHNLWFFIGGIAA